MVMVESTPAMELGAYKLEIGERVIAYFNAEKTAKPNIKGEIGAATDQILAEFAARPAKRIRGALAMAAYEMFGGTDHEKALQLAVALEVNQNSLVILDDVMDDSPTRRGGPTVQELFKKYLDADKLNVADHLATNAGHLLTYKAFKLLSRVPVDDSGRRDQLLDIYIDNMIDTGYGQARDLIGANHHVPSETEVYETIGLKTGPYTFKNPLQTGACLAGASDEDIAHLGDFGWHVGIVYQLRDDYLGIFGDEAVTGKSVLSDLREGKMTMLMHHVLACASERDKAIVGAIRGAESVTEDRLLVVQDAMRRSGALRYVEEKMYEEAEMANEILDYHTEWNAAGRAFLRKLVSDLIKRNA